LHRSERPRCSTLARVYRRGEQVNVADANPEVVQRMAKILASWRQMATGARLKPDAESTKGLTQEQLQRLRSLGYIR
jgi:hypothetical protein